MQAADHLSPEELKAFGTKLEKFAAELSSRERAYLREALVRAASPGEDDVQGYEGYVGHVLDFGCVLLPSNFRELS